MILELAGGQLSCGQSISQKSGDGHGADAAGDRSDRAGDLRDRLEINIADQFVSLAVDTDVEDDGSGLDHVSGDETRLADRGDQDVGLSNNRGKISRAAVTDRDGRVGDGSALKPLSEKTGYLGDIKAKTVQALGEDKIPNFPTAWLPTARVAERWQWLVTEKP